MSAAWRLHRQHPAVELGPADAGRLRRWLAWEEEPVFHEPGRTAWLPLAEPVPHPTVAGLTLAAAKLKGVGYSGDGAEPPGPPSGEREYLGARDQPHFGIDRDGVYVEAFSSAAPLGGIVLSRALREHENAERLLDAGVPAFVPLAVFAGERRYRDEPLGIVVTLSPEPAPFRSGSLIAAPSTVRTAAERAYREQAEHALGLGFPLGSPDGMTATFAAIAAATGATLRGFAEAGLYRHSSGLSNFQYCRSWRRFLLSDLDSSRPLAEVEYERRGLEILRDLAGAVHKAIEAIFMHPQLLRDAGLLRIVEADPVAALLRGYFPDVPADSVRRAAAAIWSYALPLAIGQDRRRRAAGSKWTRERREMHRGDKWTLYALAMMACRPLLEASELAAVGLPTRDQVGLRSALPLVGDGAVFLRWAQAQVEPDPASATAQVSGPA